MKITTPRGSGTGFVVSASKASQLCGIATAAHVVNNAHYWEEPIRIQHFNSGETFVLRKNERAILLHEKVDTAAVLVPMGSHKLPDYTLPLSPEGMTLKLGNEIGWLGFPALAPDNLCFFTGRASSYIEPDSAYLVDGVAINGVSGGPAFHLGEHFPVIIGIVSAYIANRVTGETLPGMCVVRDVTHFHDVIKHLKSMDEAKEKETPPTAAPPPPPSAPES